MDEDVMKEAAVSGNLELVQWLRREGCDWNVDACMWAAGRGHLGVLQWLRANGCPWNWHTCSYAIDEGHVEVLRWARANGCPWTANMRAQAAAKLRYTDNLEDHRPTIDLLSDDED